MSNQLETNLEIILNEKITKILPENIKSGVTILGVNGSFEGGTDVSSVTALPEDVRETKQYVNSKGELTRGTFPDASAIYTEISDSSSTQKFVYGSNNVSVQNAYFFDNTWYVYDTSTNKLVVKDMDGTYELSLNYSFGSVFISVGCKDYFGENTVIIAIGGYFNYGDRIAIYTYNYVEHTLTYKFNFDGSWTQVRPCMHPTEPYFLTTTTSRSFSTYGELFVNLHKIDDTISSASMIVSQFKPLSGDTTSAVGTYGYMGWITDKIFDFGYTDDTEFFSLCTCSLDDNFISIHKLSQHFHKMINSNASYCLIPDNNNVVLCECSMVDGDIAINSSNPITTIAGTTNSYFIGPNMVVIDNADSITIYSIENGIVNEVKTFTYSKYFSRYCNYCILVDIDLNMFNIFTGTINVLTSFNYKGVTYPNTNMANATANDILSGKTAYVNGQKIIGTLIVPMSQEEYNTALSTANNILG